MSRETKQERIVRGMANQMSEALYDLKNLSTNQTSKELDVEYWCQSLLKTCLGFTASQGYTILAQEVRGKMRPDLVVSKDGTPCFVVEIKKLGFDLNRSDFRSGKIQLAEYLRNMGNVRWGILCNGFEWRLYDFSSIESNGIEILSFDLRGENGELDLSKRGIEDACWSFVDVHESSFNGEAWPILSKEATAFSPESLAKAILSVNTVKYIARVIHGEYEYRANTEVLIEKVYQLLENGLNDSVKDWTETKQAEMARYLRSQKKAGQRRSRKIADKESEGPSSTVVSLVPKTENTSEKPSEPVSLTSELEKKVV